MIYEDKNSYFSDRGYENGDFILSGVTKRDLSCHGIDMTVKDFKQVVSKSGRYKVVFTGGMGNYRRTRVYNFKNFKHLRKGGVA